MRLALWSIGLLVSTHDAALAQADLVIATIGPMTGQYAKYGREMQTGAVQAVEDINRTGGVNGRQLKLVIEDDACDSTQAAAIAAKLVKAGVKLAAGHFCPGASIAAAKIYADADIIQISPGTTHPKFTDTRAGPNVFRVGGRDDQQAEVAGTYLAATYTGRRVAILHDRTIYGKTLADETRRFMNKAGLKEVIYEAYIAGEKDYTAIVSKLKRTAIDVVYVGGYHTEAGLIVRQMREQGMKSQLISGDALVTEEYWQITGAAGEGTLMTFQPDPRKNKAATELLERLTYKKIDAEGYVLYTYAAIQAWAQAANAATSEDVKPVTAKLNDMEFKTVLGTFRFDKKGDPNLPAYKLYKWTAGRYDQIN